MSDSPAVAAPRWERWLNPIVFKDLLTVSSNTSGAAARLFLYALLFAVPLLALAWAMTFSAGPWRLAARPVLLGFCALLSFFHVSVAVPAATAFALERDRNTLESLVISPLSPWRLVLGKLSTALAVGVMGKAAVFPALAVAVALGGADVGFVPRFLLVLVAVDVSLASFALHLGARRREMNTKVGWIKAQTSQTQLVMQATVGMSLLTSLVPIYGAIILIPIAVQSGMQLPALLADLAPLGVLHPLAALLVWGDANVFGLELPVWLLAVVFHLLLALPYLADSAEAQKTEGSEPGHLPRLLALPPMILGLVLVGAVATQFGPIVRVLAGVGFPALLLLLAAGSCSYSKNPTALVTPRRLLAGLLPPKAFASAPERALGFVLVVGLCCAPLILWAGSGSTGAWLSLAGLVGVALAVALMGARMTARAQEKEDEAFLEALARRREGREQEAKEKDDKEKETGPKRPLGYLVGGSVLLAGLPLLLLALSRSGALPWLTPFEGAFSIFASVGIALNPFAATLPAIADGTALGTGPMGAALLSWGLDTGLIFALHLLFYGLLAAASIATLRKPVDLEEAMAAGGASPAEPAPASAASEAQASELPEAPQAGEPEPVSDGSADGDDLDGDPV